MRNTTPEEQSACQSIKASLGAKLDEVSYIASSCINPFSIDMYGALIKNDDNFFFGPLTAYRQFFTMAEITRDETQREILKAIRLKKTTVKERSYIENLLKAVRCSVILGGGDYTTTNEFCPADLGPLGSDFSKPLDTSLTESSGTSYTQKRSTDFRQNSGEHRMFSKDVTHFLGTWSEDSKFNKDLTEDGLFFTMNQGKVKTPLMHTMGYTCKYNESDGIQILEIPYEGKEVSMLFLLPREKKGLPKLEKLLTASKLNQWVSGLTFPIDGVLVCIPRFRISSAPDFEDSAQKLGIRRLFSSECQFRTNNSSSHQQHPGIEQMPTQGFSMSQQAWVEVDEKGTEAYVEGRTCTKIIASDNPVTPEPVIFRADHPFIFIVRHVYTGAIIFMGRLVNP